MRILACLVALVACAPLVTAADEPLSDWLRLGPQVLVGTSGFEPGYMAEFTLKDFHNLRLRPELFLQDFERPGVGGAVLWPLPVPLPEGHSLHLGPRLAYHNGRHGDDPRGEVDAMGIYNLPIPPKEVGTPHNIELIVAIGLLDKDGTEVGFSAGAGYVYRF